MAVMERHNWTPEDIDTLTQLYTTTPISINAIAEELGLKRTQIMGKISYLKLQRPVKHHKCSMKQAKKWDPDETKKLKEMYETGIDVKDIALHFNIRVSQVKYKLKQDKIKRLPPSKGGKKHHSRIRKNLEIKFNLEDFLTLQGKNFREKHNLTTSEYTKMVKKIRHGDWRLL